MVCWVNKLDIGRYYENSARKTIWSRGRWWRVNEITPGWGGMEKGGGEVGASLSIWDSFHTEKEIWGMGDPRGTCSKSMINSDSPIIADSYPPDGAI